MGSSSVPPADAARALAEIDQRRAQVVGATLIPAWFWPSVGALVIAFSAAVEFGRPWVVAVATVGYAVGLVALIVKVTTRGAQIRTDLLGVRGALVILTLVFVPLGLGLGLSFGLHAAGAPAPATLGATASALAMAVGGPPLTRHLQRWMSRRPAEWTR